MPTVKEEMANQTIAQFVAEKLDKHYPGHAWAVNADVSQGVVKVHNLNLSGEMGFLLHMDKLINDPRLKTVVSAGGELLERYNMKRGEYDLADLDGKKVDLRGNLKHDS